MTLELKTTKKRKEEVDIEQLFREFYPQLCSYSNSFVKNIEVAEEIVQQFFVDLVYHKRYKNIKSAHSTYFFTSIKYATFKYLKSQKALYTPIEELYDMLTVEDPYMEPINYNDCLKDIINALPPKCKDVFIVVHVQKLSYQEAADILNISINTVKTQVKRALSKIRRDFPSPFLQEVYG